MSLAKSRRKSAVTPSRILPVECKNALLSKTNKMHRVKNQVLHLNSDHSITIARVKLPVPKGIPGHVIKRFDTNSISASSLFRAAFPTATEEQEEAEMNWISKLSNLKYGDTVAAGNELDPAMKLSGTWVPSNKASILAEEYFLEKFVRELIAHQQEAPQVEIIETEPESPAVTRAPKPKRQRVVSPSLPPATISISQTLPVSDPEVIIVEQTDTLIVEEEVSVTLAPTAAEEIEAEIAAAKKLVIDLKESSSSPSTESKKRDLAELTVDDPIAEPETLYDDLVDNRGVFGKIFGKAPVRRVPVNAGREIKAAGSQIALMEKKGMSSSGKLMTGIAFAVVVGATAAVPYLLG